MAGGSGKRARLAGSGAVVSRTQAGRSAIGGDRRQPGSGRGPHGAVAGLALQRCTNHKLWNLLAKAPAHLREEFADDYRRMIYAENREAVEQARRGSARKWKLRCQAVYQSFEEAGDQLFTFTAFPSEQWKALRTTNALERINEECRRRTKTQASLPNEEVVLLLLFGLLRSGQIKLRRLVGRKELASASKSAEAA